MNNLAFLPIVDLPLVAVTLGLFLWDFHRWSCRSDLDTNVDVLSRLPSARLRVIALFGGLLLVCWFFNFAVWSIVALLLVVSLAITLFVGGSVDGGALGLLAAAYLIREWSFGFPQLILHPSTNHDRSSPAQQSHELVGCTGVTASPLRPTGNAIIGDATVPVTSEDGRLIDAGTDVVVTSFRNGRLCVIPHIDATDNGKRYGRQE